MASSDESYKTWNDSLSARNAPQSEWEKFAAHGDEHKGPVPDKPGFIQRVSEVGLIQAGKEVVQALFNGAGMSKDHGRER